MLTPIQHGSSRRQSVDEFTKNVFTARELN